MHSLEILKTLPSLIFFVRNLAIYGQFTFSGQIFNNHIFIIVINEDLKGGYSNHTNDISKAKDHLTLEALPLIQFTLFSLCITCFDRAHPTAIANPSSTSDINQQLQNSEDNHIIGML